MITARPAHGRMGIELPFRNTESVGVTGDPRCHEDRRSTVGFYDNHVLPHLINIAMNTKAVKEREGGASKTSRAPFSRSDSEPVSIFRTIRPR
jgi:hypothetical protein